MNPQNMPLQPPSSLAIERQLGVFVFHLRNDRDERRRDGRPGDAPGRSTGLRITLEAMKVYPLVVFAEQASLMD